MAVTLHEGDCLAVMAEMPNNCIDSVVTDPPYELAFMSRHWDKTGIAFRPETWRSVLRVMKPGAFMVAFASTRGYHRMVCAIEDAGFLIHPMLGWLFGTGFPKATRFQQPELEGWRYGLQALKPALEPICLAQKPMIGTGSENWMTYGVGGLNIDGCRINPGERVPGGGGLKGGASSRHEGWRRQAHLANEATEAHELGRWPANVCHSGDDEVLEAFAAFGDKGGGHWAAKRGGDGVLTTGLTGDTGWRGEKDGKGNAARFFYSAKAGKEDRAGSNHPTVKPLSLIRWLCTLVCPPGGHILDPFAGSGTTGQAAALEGFNAILIEKEAEYCADIRRRLGLDEFKLSAAD